MKNEEATSKKDAPLQGPTAAFKIIRRDIVHTQRLLAGVDDKGIKWCIDLFYT